MSRTRSAVCMLVLLMCVTSEARTWKPTGQPAFSGDFLDVEGDNVRITTVSGIESIPYTSLSRSDKAVVKGNLQSRGQRDVVSRLNQLDNGRKSGSAPSTTKKSAPEPTELPTAPMTPPTTTSPDSSDTDVPGRRSANGVRNWKDILGNELQAEFVGVAGSNVELRVDGEVLLYPISGFSLSDQQWIASQPQASTTRENSPNQPPGLPSTSDGNFPGAYPGSGSSGIGNPGSGFPSMRPPGSGFPGTPGSPTMPGGPGQPGGYPGMGRPGSSMPGGPPSYGGSPGYGGPPSYGGSPGFPGGPIQHEPPSFPEPPAFPEPPEFSGGGTSFPDAYSGPPSGPAMEPPGFAGPIGGMDLLEKVLKCENCGAEFTAMSGLNSGDDCPKCSGGSSSGVTGFRMGRGVIKGVIFLVAVAAGGIGWIVKKATGTA